MSELRDECYKCLNNQNCLSMADYGSFYCMTRRKFKMPEYEDNKEIIERYYTANEDCISKQKVKDAIEKIAEYKIARSTNKGYYYDYFINQDYKEDFIKLFNELLED